MAHIHPYDVEGYADQQPADPFADMRDDLGEVYKPSSNPHKAIAPAPDAHREKCPRCGGSGMTPYTHREGGVCFSCKGVGYHEFKTSPEQRQKARARAKARKGERGRKWLEAHEAEAQWMATAAERGFEFALKMLHAVEKYGSLTDGQLAAVNRCIENDATRAVRRAQEAAEQRKRSEVVASTKIHDAFTTARLAGLKYPRIDLGGLTFKPGKAGGPNADSIWVTKGGEFMGGIKAGVFKPSRECDQDSQATIMKVVEDPKAAAVSHGLQTGSCACCRRVLTNKESIELGIGPICAERFGW